MKEEYSQTVRELIHIVETNPELEVLLDESIAAAARINPDRDTNPVQSIEEFYDFAEWSLKMLPRFILPLKSNSTLYDHVDQGVDYFYFLIDQPLKALENRGFYFNSVQYLEPFASWVKTYCRNWGHFLSTPESWTKEYAEVFFDDPDFGVPCDWFEPRSNWHTYNDFFSRKLKSPDVRPIAEPSNNHILTSPCDGYPQGLWHIDENGLIEDEKSCGVQLKSMKFCEIQRLIGLDSKYANSFNGGWLTHTFLDVNDYHRYHFPLSGKILEIRHIPGFDAGGGTYRWDASLGRYVLDCETPGWESVETRACIILDADGIGPVALLPIGMSQICSVNITTGIEVGSRVEKGQEMGYYLFGGSDFVIVLPSSVTPSYLASKAVSGYNHIFMGEAVAELK